jgi:uncharacterized protein (DUF58 family)
MLFDETSLRKLQQLTLVTSQVRAGALRGERRSLKRGAGLEFADFRDYVPGDDLRRMDWNVYARLDRPYVKLREEEEDLAVHILVDASQSMDWGQGTQHKFNYALQLAAGLGSIGLSTGDRITAVMLSEAKHLSVLPEVSLRGQQYLLHLLKFLEAQQAAGSTDLEAAVRRFLIKPRRPGLVIVISDLLSPNGYQPAVKILQQRGHEVGIVHVLSPDEVDPPLAGDLRLIDIETNSAQEVSLTADCARRIERVTAWRNRSADVLPRARRALSRRGNRSTMGRSGGVRHAEGRDGEVEP